MAKEAPGCVIGAILADPTGDTVKKLLGSAGVRSIPCLNRCESWEARQVAPPPFATKQPVFPGIPEPAMYIQLSRDLSFRKSDDPLICVEISYMGGSGEVVQQVMLNNTGDPTKAWLVSGRSVVDEDGHELRSFLPSFASSPSFAPTSTILGPATTIFVDTLGRQIVSLNPDHTWSKVSVTPWTSTTHGCSDLLSSNPADDPDAGHFFARL